MLDQPLRPWPFLGSVPPHDWSPAREEVHLALQLLAAVGHSAVVPQPDFSHESLWVRPGAKVITTQLTGGRRRLRVALSVQEMVLLILGEDEVLHAGLPLPGKGYTQAWNWLKDNFGRITGEELQLEAATHEMPRYPILEGDPFSSRGEDARVELSRLYAASQDALGRLQRDHEAALPLRLWPHHFDLAMLMPLGPGEDGVERSINAGASPGDRETEPYLFVTPWPPPPTEDLPPLTLGAWNTEGWVGAHLDLEKILDTPPLERAEIAQDFLTTATRAALRVLGR